MALRKQRGAMLIELLIGLFVGLLTTLAIVQVLSVSEGQRRATMSGEDAQVSGSLAMHALQQDLRQAAYGLAVNPAILGCPLKGDAYSGATLPSALAPITIANGAGADGFSDTITVFSSTNQGVSVPMLLTGDHLISDTTPAFVVKSTFSAATGDYLVAAPEAWSAANWCTVFKMAAATPASVTTLADALANTNCTSDNPAVAKVACTNVFHAATLAATYFPASGYPAKSYLVNLGPSIRMRTYSISTGKELQYADLGGAAVDAYPDIVDLQAFYAKDTDSNGVVDTYDVTTPTTASGWKQVIGVRVAILARSSHANDVCVKKWLSSAEKEDWASEPEWDLGTANTIGGATTVNCSSGSGGQCLKLNAAQLGADWGCYRYRLYDTMVPLRNLLWNS